jgi:Na+-driven multidrug efflux pump
MEIGANRIDLAKRYAKLLKFLTYCCAVLISSLLYFGAGPISKIFTNLEDVSAM